MKHIYKIESIKEYKELHEDLFKHHKVTYQKLQNNDCIISYKEDGTNCYAITFTYIKGILSISGDLGYAMFNWSNPNNNIIAYQNFNDMGYIMSKCVAKDRNDTNKFNSDLAQERLRELFEEYGIEEKPPYFESTIDRDYWATNEAYDLFEEDPYELGLYSIGNYLGERPYMWWVALHNCIKEIDK